MSGFTDNKALIQKADLALSELTSAGGAMPDASSKKFIKLLIKESVILGMATIKGMKSKKEKLPKIRFSSRILRDGQEATPLSLGDRSKPGLSEVELDPSLFKAEVHLNDELLEDSIEQGNLKATVMEIMGDAIARDMDEILVQGDTTSADTFLANFDGMLAAATSNVVAGGSVSINESQLTGAIKAMPSEFIRSKKNLKFLTSVDAETDWRNHVSSRATGYGDLAHQYDMKLQYSGIPIVDVPLFPENLGAGTNETNVILCDPKNICVGIWRKITIETDKDISAGIYKIVASLRFDFKYIEETAVVKVNAVTVS